MAEVLTAVCLHSMDHVLHLKASNLVVVVGALCSHLPNHLLLLMVAEELQVGVHTVEDLEEIRQDLHILSHGNQPLVFCQILHKMDPLLQMMDIVEEEDLLMAIVMLVKDNHLWIPMEIP